jgi:hypothetical protein
MPGIETDEIKDEVEDLELPIRTVEKSWRPTVGYTVNGRVFLYIAKQK